MARTRKQDALRKRRERAPSTLKNITAKVRNILKLEPTPQITKELRRLYALLDRNL